MKYPSEWMEWDMFPHELFNIQISNYEVGHERSSEHYRAGAFSWWIENSPSKEKLLCLVKLSYLDPDPLMGGSIREELDKLKLN